MEISDGALLGRMTRAGNTFWRVDGCEGRRAIWVLVAGPWWDELERSGGPQVSVFRPLPIIHLKEAGAALEALKELQWCRPHKWKRVTIGLRWGRPCPQHAWYLRLGRPMTRTYSAWKFDDGAVVPATFGMTAWEWVEQQREMGLLVLDLMAMGDGVRDPARDAMYYSGGVTP